MIINLQSVFFNFWNMHYSGCASTIYCRCTKILKFVISQSSAWKCCLSHPNRTIIHSALICYFTKRSSRAFTEGQSRDKDSEDRLGKYTQCGAPLVWEPMLSRWRLGWRVGTERWKNAQWANKWRVHLQKQMRDMRILWDNIFCNAHLSPDPHKHQLISIKSKTGIIMLRNLLHKELAVKMTASRKRNTEF